MAEQTFGMGYSKNNLSYQPSMNTLNSSYDMFMNMNKLPNNSNMPETFVNKTMEDANPLTVMQLMEIMPMLMDLDNTSYMPKMNNKKFLPTLIGGGNLNSINRFNNGGRVKMGAKDRANNPQLKSNKFYSNNY